MPTGNIASLPNKDQSEGDTDDLIEDARNFVKAAQMFVLKES